MANPEHLAILKQGAEQWNKWRDEHPDMTPYFREADLQKASLRGANLSQAILGAANLSGANLVEADLSGADFGDAVLSGTDLRGANLSKANLRLADLSFANLTTANLREAYLLLAELYQANLDGADVSRGRAGGTRFSAIDLSTVRGLETVRHRGPSTIGIDTIYKSNGKIPEVFLRGCGVPEEFIDFIISMTRRGIEFYSCFISYSSKDQEFADQLHADLQAKGVRCWFAPHDIHGGRKIHEQIDEAIRLHDKLLLILSENSMSSNWVKTEIANARQREEQEKKNLLFPITLAAMEEVKKWKLFDADRGIDSAREVREYFIPDFSRWKEHDSYQAALGKLVGDLKAG